MENNKLNSYSNEEIEAIKKQKSRNRIFGILICIAIILLGILIYEIIALAKR